jgi:hypothetical protein
MTAADTTVPAITAAGVEQVVEQVVDAWNVVGEDFCQRCHTEQCQGRRRSEPCEAIAQREMPGIGRRAHNEHGQEHPKAGCRGQPDPECD